MRTWYTTKPCAPSGKSQISHAAYDSVWEKAVTVLCERNDHVVAWVKNDHLDFKIRYLHRGSSRYYIPGLDAYRPATDIGGAGYAARIKEAPDGALQIAFGANNPRCREYRAQGNGSPMMFVTPVR